MTTRLRHSSADELNQVAHLSARSFSSDYGRRSNYFFEAQTGPGARPDLARVLEVDGKIVASVRIQDLQMKFGESILRVGGIADVGTDPEHRRKGYAARVMKDAVRHIEKEGFDISVLFGIHDYYDKFGYINALPTTSMSISVRDALKAPHKIKGRAFKQSDMPSVKRLYQQTGAQIWGNAVRNKAEWEFRSSRFEGARIFTRGKSVVAYSILATTENNCRIREFGAQADTEVLASLLHDAAEIAGRYRAGQMGIDAPADLPLVTAFTDYGLNISTTFPRNGGGMARIINLEQAVHKMLHQWSQHLAESRAKVPGPFSIETDIGAAAIAVKGKRLIPCEGKTRLTLTLPQKRLTQLMLGYQPPEFILAKADVKCSRELTETILALFPRRYAYIWPHDHF
ncbi:MAG: GNAT family N-acetyltransferase [Planctomycetota bacterium]|nr:GNAT family N-acetyltransferase [Planctomycetota bacterium]